MNNKIPPEKPTVKLSGQRRRKSKPSEIMIRKCFERAVNSQVYQEATLSGSFEGAH
jgi:hypothetical protein